MIALKRDGTWSRVTLRELRNQFPMVSFSLDILHVGADWTVDGEDFIVRIITETVSGYDPETQTKEEGPLTEVLGLPSQTWFITNKPAPVASEFVLLPYQFHSMLELNSLGGQVRAAIQSIGGADGVIAMNKLERGTEFYRDDALVISLGAVIGLTPEELDTLWLAARLL